MIARNAFSIHVSKEWVAYPFGHKQLKGLTGFAALYSFRDFASSFLWIVSIIIGPTLFRFLLLRWVLETDR